MEERKVKNIDEILGEYLEHEKMRLKERTFRDYEYIIHLFKLYLNGYGYLYLNEEDTKLFEAHVDEDEECFTKLFGQDKLTESEIREFLDYFIIRKVMGSESLMKDAIRVMKKFSKWMIVNHYTTEDQQDYFDEVKDLPKVEKLNDLIFDHTKTTPDLQYEDVMDSSFIVDKIEKGKLWLTDDFSSSHALIGPVLVTKEISDLCQEGWRINLVIGKSSKGWYILESGNVYRY